MKASDSIAVLILLASLISIVLLVVFLIGGSPLQILVILDTVAIVMLFAIVTMQLVRTEKRVGKTTSEVRVDKAFMEKGTSFKRELHTEIENMLDKFKGEFEMWHYSQNKVTFSVWKNRDDEEKDKLLGREVYFLLRTAYSKIVPLNEYLTTHQGIGADAIEVQRLDKECLLAFKEACEKAEWLKDLVKICDDNISKIGF